MSKNNKIQIYTTPSCHYCDLAKEYFKSKRLTYEEYNVVTDIERRNEMIQKTGMTSVPVMIVNGKMIMGFNKNQIENALN
jgi:glutaredoxin 3